MYVLEEAAAPRGVASDDDTLGGSKALVAYFSGLMQEQKHRLFGRRSVRLPAT